MFSNDGTNVEIISAVDILELGGDIGYKNAVQTLNDLSNAYVNSTYAESGRSLGYYDETRYTSSTTSGSEMTATELANYKTISSSLEYDLSGFPYRDYQYEPDKKTFVNNGFMYDFLYDSGFFTVWFSSRDVEYVDAKTNFYVRSIDEDGDIVNIFLFGVNYSGTTNSYGNAREYVCLVVKLKSTIKITGGSGTSADPYTITY